MVVAEDGNAPLCQDISATSRYSKATDDHATGHSGPPKRPLLHAIFSPSSRGFVVQLQLTCRLLKELISRRKEFIYFIPGKEVVTTGLIFHVELNLREDRKSVRVKSMGDLCWV